MTDQELIALIEKTEPRDLTPDHIRAIQERLGNSSELRDAFARRLELEASIAQTLGRPDVSVEAIMRQHQRDRLMGWVTPTVGITLCLAALLFGGLLLVQLLPGNAVDPVAVADSSEDNGDPPGDVAIVRFADEEPPSPDDLPIENRVGENTNVGAEPTATQITSLPYHWQAEEFARGNVETNQKEWGTKTDTVIRSTQTPAFVEYEFGLPEAAELELLVRYASFDSRPLTAIINGKPLENNIASEQTGGGAFENQQWVSAGAITFQQGGNTLRLETSGLFPHIDQWKLQLVSTDNIPAEHLNKPWSNVLAENHEPKEFDAVCFDEFDLDVHKSDLTDVQKWFTMTPGVPSYIRAFRRGNWRGGQLDGVVRLKSPWREDFTLHFLPQVESNLHIHFFAGDRGVTFSYYQHELNRWAVYETTRKADSPKPDTFVLANSDNGRNRRTEIHRGGSYLLRYSNGELVLSRGDVFLTSAHIGAVPEEVFFEGKTLIDGIELLHTSNGVTQPKERPIVIAQDRPADWKWSEPTGKGLTLNKLTDGSIQLVADKAAERGWVTTPIAGLGARFVECELVDPTPGAGLFLGRGENGEPQEIVRFFRNARDGKTCVGLNPNDDGRDRDFTTPGERLTPLVGQRVWLRMLLGAGIFHFWVSTDGEHWARSEQPWIGRPGDVTHLGLHCVAHTEKCQVTLKTVRIRELGGFAGAAPNELVDRTTKSLHKAQSYADWFSQAIIAQPENVEPGAWLRACTIATFRQGVTRQPGNELLLKLIEHSTDDFTADARIDLLADTALLMEMRDDQQPLLQLIEFAGDISGSSTDLAMASKVRRRLMRSPFHSNQTPPVFHSPAAGAEILSLVYRDSNELSRYLKTLKFFHFDDRVPLDEWAATHSGDITDRKKRLPDEWRHPLRDEIDKDVYNQLAELRALVQGEAFDDAAQRIAAIEPGRVRGLAPHSGAADWMISVPTAVDLMIREHRKLRETISAKFSDLAQLRLQRAMSQRDVAAVRLITSQFQGTPAAVKAHRWVGDWAFASGWFQQAINHYHQAETLGDSSEALNNRMRLAGAMIGENLGEPAGGNVDLGDYSLSATDFESLVTRMQQQNAGASTQQATGAGMLPNAGPLSLENKSRLDGRVGESPQSELVRNVNRYQVDWVAKQIASTVLGDTAYVSNGFQVIAYRLTDGSRVWQSEQPAGLGQMKSQSYAFTATRPLVSGDRIIARQFFGDGPMLVCLNRETGKMVWQKNASKTEHFLSDPVIIQGNLVVVAGTVLTGNGIQIEWISLNTENGEIISRKALVQLRESWKGRKFCQLATTGDGAIIALGGVVLHCDSAGDTRWVRRQIVTPTAEDDTWVRQSFQAPFVRGELAVVAQPGVRKIECFDIATGARIWQVVAPTIHRILCVADSTVVYETDAGLVAVHKDTGEFLWRTRFQERLLQAHACDANRLVVIQRMSPTDQSRTTAQIVWVDLKSGEKLGASPLHSVTHEDPRIGPMIHSNEGLWVFTGQTPTDANRDFARLKVDDSQLFVQQATYGDYPIGTSNELAAKSAAKFQGWKLLSADEKSEGSVEKVEGEADVLVLKASGGKPVVIGQRIAIPNNGSPQLKLRIGQREKHLYLAKVFVDGVLVEERKTDELVGDSQWGEFQVDLKPWAGKNVWVAIRAEGRYGGEVVDTLWRELRIIP